MVDSKSDRLLDKGSDLILQMHYHPNGKETIDQPQIGIYFTDIPPERNPAMILMGNNDVDIPGARSPSAGPTASRCRWTSKSGTSGGICT